MKKFSLLLVILMILALVSGCSKSIKTEDGTISFKDGKIEVTDEDGDTIAEVDDDGVLTYEEEDTTAEVNLSGGNMDLPQGYPEEIFPLMDGYKISSKIKEGNEEDGYFFQIGYAVDKSVDDVKEFYDNQLSDAYDYSTMSINGALGIEASFDNYYINLMIKSSVSIDGGTDVIIQIEQYVDYDDYDEDYDEDYDDYDNDYDEDYDEDYGIGLEDSMELPADYPHDILPLYKDYTVLHSKPDETSYGGNIYQIQYVVKESVKEVFEFYDNKFKDTEGYAKADWGYIVVLEVSKDNYHIKLSVTESDTVTDAAEVTLVMEEERDRTVSSEDSNTNTDEIITQEGWLPYVGEAMDMYANRLGNHIWTEGNEYQPDAKIHVRYKLAPGIDDYGDSDGVWIGIVPSNTQHGDVQLNAEESDYLVYISGPNGEIDIYAPSQNGNYDIRICDEISNQELVFFRFTVE